MASQKRREDEAYEQGVHDGQEADFMDQAMNSMTKGFTLDPRLNEIYQRGYQYGITHRPNPGASKDLEQRHREREKETNTPSVGDSSGTEVIAKIIGVLIVVAAIVWFVFSIAIPLLVINIATLALIASFIRKNLSRLLLPLSIFGAVLGVADYNLGWFTKTLAANVSFLAELIPLLVYVNVVAGSIAAYFSINTVLDKRSPDPAQARELKRRKIILMGCIVLVGGMTVGLQVWVDSRRRNPQQSTAAANPTLSGGTSKTAARIDPSSGSASPTTAAKGTAISLPPAALPFGANQMEAQKSKAANIMEGTISNFGCGDNCYLTITDGKGKEHIGLCLAPLCNAWAGLQEMPAQYKGKRVQVMIGKGKQYNASGKVMGTHDAFTRVQLLK